jgi:hypothetical protein
MHAMRDPRATEKRESRQAAKPQRNWGAQAPAHLSWRLGGLAALLLLPSILPSVARADGTSSRIHLHGSARIDAHAARAGGRLSLAGTVLDDTARAIAGAKVALTITPANGGDALVLANAAASACSDGAPMPALETRDTLVLPTDDAARFCVRLALPTDRYVAHLETRSGGLVDVAKLDVPVDLALAPLTLRFDPEPATLSLDDEGASFEVIASTEDDGVTTAAAGLPLALSNEAGVALGTAATNASGRARFAVDAARLGAPGRGELRVVFAGAAFAAAATHAAQIERRTHVDLTAPDVATSGESEGQLPPGSPEDGIGVRVVATPRCAKRGCAGAATGTVEARVGDVSAMAGAAPLEGGEARVVATFAMPPAETAQLRLRYVPDSPWLLPAGELTVVQPVHASSPWRKLPLFFAGLLAVGWLVLARLPPRKPAAPRESRPPRSIRPEAGVELVRAGPAAKGWSGTLRDAHDGWAVPGARVAIERRGFDRVETVTHTWADSEGAFVLPHIETRPGDELVAEGQLHCEVRRPLPGPGELGVAMVLRRRALVDRLVAWARRRGNPFDARPEPTPGHVRRAASAEFSVARWADAVERAAYGGQVVDAHAQAEVDRLAPTPAPAGGASEGPAGKPGPGAR